MTMSDLLKAAKLRATPFRIVPPTDMDNIIWAGDRTIIKNLTEATRSPRPDRLGTSELVVLWGEYGSGKTHVLKFLAKKLREEDQLVAYIPRPSITDRPTWKDLVREMFATQFLREDIIRRLSSFRDFVLGQARDLARTELGGEGQPDRLIALEREKREEIYREVLPVNPGFVRFMMDLSNPNDTNALDANWGYLATALTAGQANMIATKYGLPAEGLRNDHGASTLLEYFIKVVTFPTGNGAGSDVVYLFLDECENINDIAPAGRLSILTGLRDLFNFVTEHMFIAISATGSDASELYGILDEPLMQRLSRRPYPIPQLDPASAKEFLLDEMSQFRPSNFGGPPEWPFSSEGIDAFVENCPPPLTLRKLNVSASRIIFEKYGGKILREEPIDAADVSEFVDWAG
jgi:hypothetical protein